MLDVVETNFFAFNLENFGSQGPSLDPSFKSISRMLPTG